VLAGVEGEAGAHSPKANPVGEVVPEVALGARAGGAGSRGRRGSSEAYSSDEEEAEEPVSPAVEEEARTPVRIKSGATAQPVQPRNKGFFAPEEEAAAAAALLPPEVVAALTAQAGAMAMGNDSSFRRRRLTFATQGNIPPHTPLCQIQQRVFRSLEIGDVPKVPLPFAEGLVGTYSCHGIEPAAFGPRPFVAKINQDRGVCVYPFAGDERMALFAVFDGHGEFGDKVSEFCMFEVPKALEGNPGLLKLEAEAKGTGTDADADAGVVAAFKETFLEADDRLGRSPAIEAFYSGTTAVVALVQGNRLWVGNAGDSRCVLATVREGQLVAQDLSVDQNPDSPAEMERILAAGGFVSPPPEPGLSARVWLDADLTQVGLAMARSIGDHAVKGVGVIAEPEVLTHEVSPEEDRFLLLASDGVWEFISSDEAVAIVHENMRRGVSQACQALIENAAARWRDVEGDYRDDITALVIRLPLWRD
jgi:protein phosphatase PTC2/3